MGAIGDIFIRAASDEERIEDTARLEEEEKEREEREQPVMKSGLRRRRMTSITLWRNSMKRQGFQK